MSQTSINKAGQPIAVAGQLSDNQNADVVSRFNSAAAEIQFGCGVKAGTAKHAVILPAASTDVVEGISVYNLNHTPGSTGDIGTAGLKQNAGLQILRDGRIWVQLDASGVASVTPYTDRGWCRCVSSGGNTILGAWSNAQDSTNNIDCTKQTQFVSGLQLAADGTKIAELECDFTNKP